MYTNTVDVSANKLLQPLYNSSSLKALLLATRKAKDICPQNLSRCLELLFKIKTRIVFIKDNKDLILKRFELTDGTAESADANSLYGWNRIAEVILSGSTLGGIGGCSTAELVALFKSHKAGTRNEALNAKTIAIYATIFKRLNPSECQMVQHYFNLCDSRFLRYHPLATTKALQHICNKTSLKDSSKRPLENSLATWVVESIVVRLFRGSMPKDRTAENLRVVDIPAALLIRSIRILFATTYRFEDKDDRCHQYKPSEIYDVVFKSFPVFHNVLPRGKPLTLYDAKEYPDTIGPVVGSLPHSVGWDFAEEAFPYALISTRNFPEALA